MFQEVMKSLADKGHQVDVTLAEFYAAFIEISPIHVLMKVASPQDLPSGIPENVLTLTWTPQANISKHHNIRAFVTHGGSLGIQEAVVFTVPLIGIPLFGDQSLNINNCVEREVAWSLNYEEITVEKFVEAVNAVVRDPKYKDNMIALSKKFLDRATTARNTAVFCIEYILKHGGDILRSPAITLTWWQLAWLVVYGSLIAAVLLSFYVIKRIFFALFCHISYTRKSVLKLKKIS